MDMWHSGRGQCFNLRRHTWSLMNRFRTGQGPCHANLHKWGLAQSSSCDCGQRPTINHIVDTCPLTKIWSWTESTAQSGWWCSHMAGISSDCSTREIIIIVDRCPGGELRERCTLALVLQQGGLWWCGSVLWGCWWLEMCGVWGGGPGPGGGPAGRGLWACGLDGRMLWIVADGGSIVDKGCLMIRMGMSGWMFLLVPAYLGSPGSEAVKRLCVCVPVITSVLLSFVC